MIQAVQEPRRANGSTGTLAVLALLVSAGCDDGSSAEVVADPPSSVVASATTPGIEGAADAPMPTANVPPTDSVSVPTATHSPSASKPPVEVRIKSISFDDIAFKMEKGTPFKRSMLTKAIEGYAGRPIQLRGFILPSFKQDGITEFVLVRDNMECCFGPGAALFDCVMVRMVPGKTASFSVRPVTVEGEFGIEEWKDFDGVVRAIYHMKGTSVK